MYEDEAAMKDDLNEEEDEAAMKDDEPMEGLYEEEEEMGKEGMDEADVELDEELVQKFMEAAATIQEVSDALGGGAGGDMDDDMDMDMDMGGDKPADDLDMDMGGDEPEAEEGGDDEEMALQEALRGINYVPSQKEIVKTVAQRVAKRLQEAKQAQAKLNKALGKK